LREQTQAEYASSSITRNLHAEATSVRAGGWQVGLGVDVNGKTLGLLGLGKIGQAVARMGQAFGMRTIAWSQNLTAEVAAEHGVERVDKDQLFREADVLSVHLKLGERTCGIVGERELALMKPSAYLVNTSRGPIVSEPALIEALQARHSTCSMKSRSRLDIRTGSCPTCWRPRILATLPKTLTAPPIHRLSKRSGPGLTVRRSVNCRFEGCGCGFSALGTR